MQQDVVSSDLIDLTEEVHSPSGVSFNSDAITLTGSYADQLSAYRAKKLWAEALELNFLLDTGHDFTMRVESDLTASRFTLTCEFATACGRYAFWRLTHNQAPEVQYLIETAHIPSSESRHHDFLAAPDLYASGESPHYKSGERPQPMIFQRYGRGQHTPSVTGWFRNILGRLAKLTF